MSKSPLIYLGNRTRKSYGWRRRQSTAEWVESNVYLNQDASPITGYMNLKFTPHLREMFDDYDKVHVWKQIGKFSTQTGKTSWILCIMAKKLDTKPAKLQWAIPNEDKVTEYIEDKIDPFLKGVQSLLNKTEDYVQKEKARLKRSRIKVAGGDCVFTGASASSKRSKSVREIYMDEADLFSDGSITEFEGRTKASEKFSRKVIAVSSQKKKNGEIKKAYDSCETIKEWHTKCDCEHHWLAGSRDLKYLSKSEYRKANNMDKDEGLDFSKYKAEALLDVFVECPECGEHITSSKKDTNILGGKYKFHVVAGVEDGKTIAYAGNALAMYFTSFETIAGLMMDADNHGTFEDMAQIYLDYFDEIYEFQSKDKVSKSDILLLSNGLEEGILPRNTSMVVMGIDTQKNHFWYKIKAYEYGNRGHTIMAGRAETTDELEALFGMRFPCEDGTERGIDAVGIDRMGIKERTIEVDAWVEYLVVNQGLEDFIYLTMGQQSDGAGRPWFMTEVNKDLTTDERRKTPLKAIRLNNTLLKNEIAKKLDRSISRAKAEDGSEEEQFETRLYFVNQTIVDNAHKKEKSVATDYERQMTSEHYIFKVNEKTGKLATSQTWEKKSNSIDNHYLDCDVICEALAMKGHISTLTKPIDMSADDIIRDMIPD